MNKKMLNALNKQVNEELASAYIYLSMSAYFKAEGWNGMASWMHKQFQEELGHAGKFSSYIVDRGGRVELDAIAKPDHTWESPLAVYKAAYKHECHISKCIHDLVKLARAEDDIATENMLAWFVEEQVEEEATAMEVVDTLNKVGDKPGALFMYDQVLGKRE
jgi:ferritin